MSKTAAILTALAAAGIGYVVVRKYGPSLREQVLALVEADAFSSDPNDYEIDSPVVHRTAKSQDS